MEDKEIKIKLYRHKEYKNIYLVRNWHIWGGCVDTDWFSTTQSLYDAVENSLKYYGYDKGDIEKEYINKLHSFPKNKAKAILKKEMDFDGYKGELTKELMLPIEDFELITLVIDE